MIEYIELEEKIKSLKLDNCYVFCGADEALMKEKVKAIAGKVLQGGFAELNYVQFDGLTADMEEVVNTCETIPFISDKKVVVVYRAAFLGDGEDRDSAKKYAAVSKYIDNPAGHCIFIMYHVFESDRDKPGSKIKKLEKKACVVKFDKLKGFNLEKKVKSMFDEKGKNIGKIELKLFCDNLENNMHIIQNEVEKLCTYAYNREITKEDVLLMLPQKSDNDIFNLVDVISQKKVEKAIDILNQLIFKGEKVPYILYMVERQFNLILQLKYGVEEGKDKDALAKELKLNPFICEKMIAQSRKFTMKAIKKAVQYCLNTEEALKSSSVNGKTEMELLILNTITA